MKEKAINYMSNGKVMIIHLTVGLIKKKLYKGGNKCEGTNVKVELDLSNYATKTDLKDAAGVDTSDFAKKTDLVNLKSNVDKLDIDKLKNVPRNLSNLEIRVDKLDVDKLVPVFC